MEVNEGVGMASGDDGSQPDGGQLYYVQSSGDPETDMQNSQSETSILDEQSIQQLVNSGSDIPEDSIIAIVQNENGEPQTVVLTRPEAEALGIQLDSIEQQEPLENQESAEQSEQSEHAEHAEQQPEEMEESQQVMEEQQDKEIAQLEFNSQQAPKDDDHDILMPDPPIVPPTSVTPVSLESSPQVETVHPLVTPLQTPAASSTDPVVSTSTEEESQTTTVSLDSVPQQIDGDEASANDVLSNIIQSLFNPNEPNQSNVSIVPRMVGGKRKLCLRLPASTASALLAQTGSPLGTSFTSEGGVPKKIKIVIPPTSSAAASLTSATSSLNASSEPKVIKVSMHGTPPGTKSLDGEGVATGTAKSSKPFLASLFSGNQRYSRCNIRVVNILNMLLSSFQWGHLIVTNDSVAVATASC